MGHSSLTTVSVKNNQTFQILSTCSIVRDMNTPDLSVTELLKASAHGDALANHALLPLVYDELKKLAAKHMQGEASNHTWQATELVHEAFIKLAGAKVEWNDRRHFCSVASRAMRRILVDHARAKKAKKRGGGEIHVTLLNDQPNQSISIEDILALDQALTKLDALDKRKSQIIELTYFSGMNQADIAAYLDLPKTSLHRELKFCKAWLKKELGGRYDK